MKNPKNPKVKTLFDHLRAITQEPYNPQYWQQLSDSDKKTFSTFMINRYLSMNPDWIEWVNTVQLYGYGMSPEMMYKVYATTIPKSRIFLKYISAKKDGVDKYDPELIKIIAMHFEVSKKQATEYIELLSKQELIDILNARAIDDIEIKKMVKNKK